MGGTERNPEKPRPSYEKGVLRDPKIEEAQDPSFNRSAMLSLIRKATKTSDATGRSPADRA